MAQVVIRNLDDDVKASLKKQAAKHGWSMEEEARQILRNALKENATSTSRLGSKIVARFTGAGLDFELSELHGQTVPPMDFDA